jgi:hypothetical protein
VLFLLFTALDCLFLAVVIEREDYFLNDEIDLVCQYSNVACIARGAEWCLSIHSFISQKVRQVCRSFCVGQTNLVFFVCLYGTGMLFEKITRIVDYLSMMLGISRIIRGNPIFDIFILYMSL